MSELDLATSFAIIRANWNRYCDQLQGIGYGGCTDDCYDEDEYADDPRDYGLSRGRHTERDRSSRKHDRRSRTW